MTIHDLNENTLVSNIDTEEKRSEKRDSDAELSIPQENEKI